MWNSETFAFLVIVLIGALVIPTLASADAVSTVTVDLTPGAVVHPSSGSTRSATAIITWDDAQSILGFNIDLGSDFDLDGDQTPTDVMDDMIGLHIHHGSVKGPDGFIGLPVFGVAGDSGDGSETIINASQGNVTGTWKFNSEGKSVLNPAQRHAALFADEFYIDVHTMEFSGGDVRGEITGVRSVPEPSAGVLSLFGLLSLGVMVQRHRYGR